LANYKPFSEYVSIAEVTRHECECTSTNYPSANLIGVDTRAASSFKTNSWRLKQILAKTSRVPMNEQVAVDC